MDSKKFECNALIELDVSELVQVAGGESVSLNYSKIEYHYSTQSAH